MIAECGSRLAQLQLNLTQCGAFKPTNAAAGCTMTFDGNGFKIGPQTPFVLEAPAELRALHDARCNPARNIDTAVRPKGQRDVASERAQEGASVLLRWRCRL
jgi:hypothetical protein